jgi:hypothetical protein
MARPHLSRKDTGMSSSPIDDYLAKQEIYELSCRYSRGLDRLDAELLMSVFSDDAYCEYGIYNGPPGPFVEFALQALGEHAANQHLVGQVLVDVEGEEAFGEVYFQAYHKVPAGEHFEDLMISGRYLDMYERRDGSWKIAYRSERNDWSHTRPTCDPYFEAAADGLRGSRRDDAVYDRERRRQRS